MNTAFKGELWIYIFLYEKENSFSLQDVLRSELSKDTKADVRIKAIHSFFFCMCRVNLRNFFMSDYVLNILHLLDSL